MRWFRRKSSSSRRLRDGDPQTDLRIIREKFAHFRTLLESNNEVLQIIADMEEKAEGDYLFDTNYIRACLARLRPRVTGIIESMIALGGRDYETLRDRYRLIDTQIDVALPGNRPLLKDSYTRSFHKLERMHSYSVGSKNAQLGEMKSVLGLPVPDGFAITAWAYKHFIDANKLQEQISSRISAIDLRNPDNLAHASFEIRNLIRQSPVPDDQVEAIEEASRKLAAHSSTDRFSMRSSAVGEDTLFSFAGQYASYLNVRSDQLVQYYREVLASKFTPQAIYYFLSHDLSESELAMSVGCVAMIDAAAAGVVYTRSPVNPADDRVVLHSIFGLGKYLVDGTLTPDTFRVSRSSFAIEERDIHNKPLKLVLRSGGGTQALNIPSSMQDQPSLDDAHLRELARYAVKLEAHYGMPQDIEWVLDQEGRIVLLQTRPLQVVRARANVSLPEIPESTILLKGGTTVCHGAGSGKIHHVSQRSDLPGVPDGAVLVAPHPFPGLITVMGKIAALVTQIGGTASHMATIAREYGIPTIVGVPEARDLPSGRMVTVDATAVTVYDGNQEALVAARQPEYSRVDEGTIYDVLGRVLDLISPLRLLYPDQEDFVAENCVTLHDITRFSHQRATEEMFLGATDILDKDRISLRLKTDFPLRINVIYIDREYDVTASGGWVTMDELASQPMETFWKGVAAQGWPRAAGSTTAKPVGVMAGSEGQIHARLAYSESSYAILGHEYMILSLRMGYHLATVEAMCSPELNKNYIRMQFSCGGATLDRRMRRVRLITDILTTMKFECRRKSDYMNATMSHKDQQTVCHNLHLLGRLTMMTKQLDMALSSDKVAKWYTQDFLRQLGLDKNDRNPEGTSPTASEDQ